MPMNLNDIAAFLDEEGLKYQKLEDYLRLSFSTDTYRDAEGESAVFMIAKLEEEGEYFKLIAPCLYYCKKTGAAAAAVFQTLLMISWRTKLIQFQYDDTDGEIRAIIEFPLEDGTLTKRQFLRCMNGLAQIVDDYHAAIAGAIRTGAVCFDEDGRPAELGREAEEIYSYLGEKPPESRERLELEE